MHVRIVACTYEVQAETFSLQYVPKKIVVCSENSLEALLSNASLEILRKRMQ